MLRNTRRYAIVSTLFLSGLLLVVTIFPVSAETESLSEKTPFELSSASEAVAKTVVGANEGKLSVDPFEPLNRSVFAFNRTFDSIITKPVALAYVSVTPQWLRDRVKSFYFNLEEVLNFVNCTLQGKFYQASTASTRFMINSTLGIGGLFDVALEMGLQRHEEDFGQTLAVWGIGAGPFIELPFLGPSTFRDAFSIMPDRYVDLVRSVKHIPTKNTVRGVELVDLRASYLPYDDIVSGDKYLFIRNAYIQTREFAIADGKLEDDFLDDDFLEDESF